MATQTGKKARKMHGTRFAAKRAKSRKGKKGAKSNRFGKLTYSVLNKTAGNVPPSGFVRAADAPELLPEVYE